MKVLRSSLRKSLPGIITGAVLLVLASMWAWIAGRIPSLLEGAGGVLSKLMALLSLRVSIPLWATGAVAVLATLALRAAVRQLRAERPPVAAAVSEQGTPSLSALEHDILRVLSDADGESVSIGEFRDDLSVPILRLEQALDQMRALDLVRPTLDGTILTKRGRDLAIEIGYVCPF